MNLHAKVDPPENITKNTEVAKTDSASKNAETDKSPSKTAETNKSPKHSSNEESSLSKKNVKNEKQKSMFML